VECSLPIYEQITNELSNVIIDVVDEKQVEELLPIESLPCERLVSYTVKIDMLTRHVNLLVKQCHRSRFTDDNGNKQQYPCCERTIVKGRYIFIGTHRNTERSANSRISIALVKHHSGMRIELFDRYEHSGLSIVRSIQ
jgi:hypothetical protein